MDFHEEFINKYFEYGAKSQILKAIENTEINQLTLYQLEDLQCVLSLFLINVDRAKRFKIREFYEQNNLENTFSFFDR